MGRFNATGALSGVISAALGGWVAEHWGDQGSLGLPVIDVGLSLLLTLALRPGHTHVCW
jgi:hypothetical protein